MATGLVMTPQSLGEQVAATLRDAILSGQLVPGQALREATVANDLQVARNTVREALRILAGERLVTYQLHHGVLVSPLNESDVTDLYNVRATLEPVALLDFSTHQPDRVQAVVDAVRRYEEAARHSDLETIVTRDLEIHQAIVALSGSPRLNDFFREVCAEVRRCVLLVFYANVDHETPASAVGHRQILNALVAGRYEEAASVARGHIYETRDQALTLIRHAAATSEDASTTSMAPPRPRARSRTSPQRQSRKGSATTT